MAQSSLSQQGEHLMHRGDIFLVPFDPTQEHNKQQGNQDSGQPMRTVIVISPLAFNTLTQTPIILPITTDGDFARTAGFGVTLVDTKTQGVVRCDQPRTMALRSLNATKVENAPKEIVLDILAKVGAILS